jgi:hypothetical protein
MQPREIGVQKIQTIVCQASVAPPLSKIRLNRPAHVWIKPTHLLRDVLICCLVARWGSNSPKKVEGVVLMLSNAMNIRRLQSYFHYVYVVVRFEPIEMLGSTVHDAIVLACGDN